MIDPAGKISIRGLELDAHIGVTDEEQEAMQKILVDIDIDADLRTAAASDDVADTIDYGSVVEDVARLVEGSRFRLLERLGSEIAELICRYPRVARVTVVVGKESPPIDEDVEGISIGVTRATGENPQ